MPRDVTVQFGDGSSHIYQNVPDNVTPDQVTARAGQDFGGRQVTGIDGGRAGGGGDWTDTAKRVAGGLWRGLAHGMLPSDVAHFDPQTKHYVTGESRQEEAAKPTDRASRLSELAGEFMVQPMIAGGKAVDAASRLLTESRVGRALGIGEGERGYFPLRADVDPAQAGSLAAARATDQAAGTLGQRGGVTVLGQRLPGLTTATGRAAQAIEPRVARHLGGGALREALSAPERMSADEIAANLQRAAQGRRASVLRGGYERAAQTLEQMLGRNAQGAIDADHFMEEWMAMTPAQRNTIFGASAIGGQFASDMTRLATNIERLQQLARRRPLRDLAARIPQSMKGTAGALLVAGGVWNAGSIIHALMNWKLALTVAGGAALAGGGNRLMAEALTNPSTVAWLAAQSTRMLTSLKTRDKGTYDEPLSHLEGDL